MKNIGYILLLSAILFGSCIRDEIGSCPPLSVNIMVKDKNYLNVDKVTLEERKSEELAFKEYVPTLYYRLCDAVTGEVVEEQGVFEVSGNDKTFTVTFCDCIPHGKYILTVWGGLEDNMPLDDTSLTATLHGGNAEKGDYYMTNDTLVYDAWNYDYSVGLERTKGKLIVEVENLPEKVDYMDEQTDGLLEQVDCGFNYSGTVSVRKSFEWGAGPEVVNKTVLSPSYKEKGSVVDIDFFDDPAKTTPVLNPRDVSVTMRRNELTVLRYVYDEDKDRFAIYLLVNDNWEEVHGLIID